MTTFTGLHLFHVQTKNLLFIQCKNNTDSILSPLGNNNNQVQVDTVQPRLTMVVSHSKATVIRALHAFLDNDDEQ